MVTPFIGNRYHLKFFQRTSHLLRTKTPFFSIVDDYGEHDEEKLINESIIARETRKC